jgi:hypothetical protein
VRRPWSGQYVRGYRDGAVPAELRTRISRPGRGRGPDRAASPGVPAAVALAGPAGHRRWQLGVLDGDAHPLLVQRAAGLDGQPAVPGQHELGRCVVVDRPRRPDGGHRLPRHRAFHQPRNRGGRPGPGRRLALEEGGKRPAGQRGQRAHRQHALLAERPGAGRQHEADRAEQQHRDGETRLLRRQPPGAVELPRQPHRPVAEHRRAAEERVERRVPGAADRHLLPRGLRWPAGRLLLPVVPVRAGPPRATPE